MQQFFQTHPIQINNLPIYIVCCSDGTLAFVCINSVFTIFDENEQYKAIYTEESFTVNGEEYEYHTRYPYKEMPNLLAWLIAQNMLNPVQGEN